MKKRIFLSILILVFISIVIIFMAGLIPERSASPLPSESPLVLSEVSPTNLPTNQQSVAGSLSRNELQSIIDKAESGSEIKLPDADINLLGKTILINKPLTITGGSGVIRSGYFLIEKTKDVQLIGLITNNFHINIHESSMVNINNCVFEHVEGDVRGAIAVSGSCNDLFIDSNSFTDLSFGSSATTYGCGIKMELVNASINGLTIEKNIFSNIHGPAAIWMGGSDATFERFTIKDNTITMTESFGIEFYQVSGKGTFLKTGRIEGNTMEDIGLLRLEGQEERSGSGSGGIYSNCISQNVDIIGNSIKRVVEVGIEGKFSRVMNNYIEDTGTDYLNHRIKDNAGIYWGGKEISGNTIVNPGDNGGIHLFSEGAVEGTVFKDNIVINKMTRWQPDVSYNTGNLIVSEDTWFVCTQSGVSGKIAPGGLSEAVNDGSCIWKYKKKLATTAIRINAALGIENVLISGNSTYEFDKFAFFSAFKKDVSITGNRQYILTESRTDLIIEGYGSKNGLSSGSQKLTKQQ